MLEPGKAAKTDKSSIITDAIRVVTQLRAENGQLRQLNKFLEVHPASIACNDLLLLGSVSSMLHYRLTYRHLSKKRTEIFCQMYSR